MAKRFVSLFSLAAAYLSFGVAIVRLGFDLYKGSFTREEILLLVALLIAALIAFLIGKVTETPEVCGAAGARGKSGTPTRFAKHINEPLCLTCEYWHGDRIPEPKSRNVITRSSTSPGTCIHGGGKTSKKASTAPCGSYETWRLLA